MSRHFFLDRADAGKALAAKLFEYRGLPDLLVLGLPRGGVPVAYEVATALGAELDVLIVRKIGAPSFPELAVGAIASGGALYVNEDIKHELGVTEELFQTEVARETEELHRREHLYRKARRRLRVSGRTVIVVDDGVATGASMLAALLALKSLKPAALICAIPVAPPETAEKLTQVADRLVCVELAANFRAVGQFYQIFDQTSDEEVCRLLGTEVENDQA